MSGGGREKNKALFIRVSERERKIIEAACKIRHGKVRGFLSDFVRHGALLYAKTIIQDAKARRGE